MILMLFFQIQRIPVNSVIPGIHSFQLNAFSSKAADSLA